ncbi:MAG: AMP-binding protein, partial [Gammaproteobacteria bacterium]|nr:AMP-binding protein [Gammaproteobacteria bacterium]
MEKIWLKSYPDSMPAELPPSDVRSLREMFERTFAKYPERAAYTNMGTTISYRDLDRMSMQLACYLQQTLGLTRGERVAIMLPNVLQYPIALCGIFRAGCVVVNVNPMYTARELEHQLKDSGARCVIILENFAHTLADIIEHTSVRHAIVTGVGDLLSFPRGLLTNFVLRHVKRLVPRYSLPGSIGFTDALQAGAGQKLAVMELGFADIAFLQYTGGTTGVSKGAMLSHRNMVCNVQQTILWQAGAYSDLDAIVAITALPLYHIFSLQGNCLTLMAQGGHNILITNPRDFEAFAKEMARYPFNLFTAVNTIFAALLHTRSFARIDFSSLRVCVGGGMAVQPAIAREWRERTGSPILQGYGLTETSPAAIVNPIGEEFSGSIGIPLSSTNV